MAGPIINQTPFFPRMKNKLLPLLLLPLLVTSCSKSDSNKAAPSGPKEYQVEYRIAAVNYPQADIIVYRNETGAQTSEQNVPLPKTYSFKRVMKSAETLDCQASALGGDATSTITVTVVLDGKTVATKSETGPNPQPVASYQIP